LRGELTAWSSRRPARVGRQRPQALEAAGGDPAEAGRRLGLSRATVYRRMKKHGLSR